MDVVLAVDVGGTKMAVGLMTMAVTAHMIARLTLWRPRVFINLPMASLDRMSLQAQVDALGSSHN